MTKINQTELYKDFISLSEWFEKIKYKNIKSFREEDNEKRERLKVLNEIISLPFDRPVQFPATSLFNLTADFKEYLKDHSKELCALRLIPLEDNLPKLRMRGHTVKKAMEWFKEQKIDPEKYKADFIPHSDTQTYSTIFIINKKGIFGEIIKGGHYQLTSGVYDEGEPVTFSFNFKKITLSEKNPELQKYLKNIFTKIKVRKNLQPKLKKELKSKFYKNYLLGYFETVDTEEFGLWFVDYNRLLGQIYADFKTRQIVADKKAILSGLIGSKGKVSGKVRIITDNLDQKLKKGEILVCPMTTPAHLLLMKQSAGIITDQGGILSHAAIIARELKKPCLTSTKVATKLLKDGDKIILDANKGVVTLLKA